MQKIYLKNISEMNNKVWLKMIIKDGSSTLYTIMI